MFRCCIWVVSITCADHRRWSRRVGGQTGREAKVKFWCAVPHAFDAGREAMDRLYGLVGRVLVCCGAWRAPDEVCSGVLRVVDRVADLTSYMAEVA